MAVSTYTRVNTAGNNETYKSLHLRGNDVALKTEAMDEVHGSYPRDYK
jgi:hypothetical protein